MANVFHRRKPMKRFQNKISINIVVPRSAGETEQLVHGVRLQYFSLSCCSEFTTPPPIERNKFAQI